jgi:hypothetical protein
MRVGGDTDSIGSEFLTLMPSPTEPIYDQQVHCIMLGAQFVGN